MAARIVCLRRRLISAFISRLSPLIQIPSKPLPSSDLLYNALVQSPSIIISQRSFSWWAVYGKKSEANATHSFKQEENQQQEKEVESLESSVPESGTFEQNSVSAFDSVESNIATESASNGIGWHTPVDGVVAFIDGLHTFTGLPWWLTIVASTVAIRLAILPVLILQLKKMDRISEILPKLPPPLPMPGSGISLRQQYTLFTQQRRAMGCPTFVWSFASIAAQVPCFICSMLAVRGMCLEPHPGFDSGGAIWFVDLTEYAHGPLGALFPISIAGMHFLIVQINFQMLKDAKISGFFATIRKYYKIWLEIVTVPVFITGFYVPQGSLVYWLTNSVCIATQHLSLMHPSFRKKLGLRVHPKEPKSGESIFQLGNGKLMDQLSSNDLCVLAARHVAEGQLDRALQVLRAAVEKDPEMSEAYLALGTIQSKKKLFAEAVEHFELAIAKGKNDDVLISAYREVGVALLNQGKVVEAIAHLRKIAAFEEPTEPNSKTNYYRGLVMLASALLQDGKKSEAAQYLRLAAKYDPSVNIYLRECEKT